MIRFYDPVSRLLMCAAGALLVCSGLAFSLTAALADGGDPAAGPPQCPCIRCVNVCGGVPPCVGTCNAPDSVCVAAGANCNNCNCKNGNAGSCGCY